MNCTRLLCPGAAYVALLNLTLATLAAADQPPAPTPAPAPAPAHDPAPAPAPAPARDPAPAPPPPAAEIPAPPPAASTKPPLISPDQQKYWIDLQETSGADRLWKFIKSDFRGTVLLTTTDLGEVKLEVIIKKVLDQIDKQFLLKPAQTDHQFVAANCMGYKVVYESSTRGAARYQVQYFIPKSGKLYILTCSCRKGTEDAVGFDQFAASFTPPEKK